VEGRYAYLEQREAAYEQENAAYKNQQKEIASLREFYDRFRQVASKASEAMSKLKQIERTDPIDKPSAAEEAVPVHHSAADRPEWSEGDSRSITSINPDGD